MATRAPKHEAEPVAETPPVEAPASEVFEVAALAAESEALVGAAEAISEAVTGDSAEVPEIVMDPAPVPDTEDGAAPDADEDPGEAPAAPLFDVDAVADLDDVHAEEPPPIRHRERIRVCVADGVYLPAEVVRVDGYGISALVHLDGYPLSRDLRRRGNPARNGEAHVIARMTEGPDVGQWSRLP